MTEIGEETEESVDQVLAERQFVGNLHGIARPAAWLKPAMRELHGVVEGETSLDIPLAQAMDEGKAIVELASLIDSGIERFKRPDGSVDTLVVASHILKRIKSGDTK